MLDSANATPSIQYRNYSTTVGQLLGTNRVLLTSEGLYPERTTPAGVLAARTDLQ